jgi:hypothetical protein
MTYLMEVFLFLATSIKYELNNLSGLIGITPFKVQSLTTTKIRLAGADAIYATNQNVASLPGISSDQASREKAGQANMKANTNNRPRLSPGKGRAARRKAIVRKGNTTTSKRSRPVPGPPKPFGSSSASILSMPWRSVLE